MTESARHEIVSRRLSAIGSLFRVSGSLLFLLLLSPSSVTGEPTRELKLVASFPVDIRGISGPAFLPGAHLLAADRGADLVIWEVPSGKVHAIFKPKKGAAGYPPLAFSQDGRFLVAMHGLHKSINIWDVQTGSVCHKLTLTNSPFIFFRLSPDGKTVASGGTNGTVRVWDLKSGKRKLTLPTQKKRFYVSALDYSPDGKLLALGGGPGAIPTWGEAQVWDVTTPRPKRVFREKFDGSIQSLVFFPDGNSLILIEASIFPDVLQIWNTKTGERLQSWDAGIQTVEAMVFSSRGKILAIAGTEPHPKHIVRTVGKMRLLDARTGKELATIRTSGGIYGVSFSSDGKYLAVAGEMKKILVWDISALTNPNK